MGYIDRQMDVVMSIFIFIPHRQSIFIFIPHMRCAQLYDRHVHLKAVRYALHEHLMSLTHRDTAKHMTP